MEGFLNFIISLWLGFYYKNSDSWFFSSILHRSYLKVCFNSCSNYCVRLIHYRGTSRSSLPKFDYTFISSTGYFKLTISLLITLIFSLMVSIESRGLYPYEWKNDFFPLFFYFISYSWILIIFVLSTYCES